MWLNNEWRDRSVPLYNCDWCIIYKVNASMVNTHHFATPCSTLMTFSTKTVCQIKYTVYLLKSKCLTIAVFLGRYIPVKQVLDLSHDSVSTFGRSFHARNHIIDRKRHVSHGVVTTVTEIHVITKSNKLYKKLWDEEIMKQTKQEPWFFHPVVFF
jgi:hypothetical protein